MMFCLYFVITFLLVYPCFWCQVSPRQEKNNSDNSTGVLSVSTLPSEYNLIKKYPYIAPTDYCRDVNEKILEIQIGDNYEKVCKILPTATELIYIYDYKHIFDPEQRHGPIGFAQIFVFERKQENGSFNDQARVEYGIMYDLTRRVIEISSLRHDVPNKVKKIHIPSEYCSIQSYPYFADSDYCQIVNENIEEIDIGDRYEDVCKRLPPATIVHHLYSTKHSTTPIGFALWYIFEQKARYGSLKDKAEVGYVIKFNKYGLVECLYSLGDDISSLAKKILSM